MTMKRKRDKNTESVNERGNSSESPLDFVYKATELLISKMVQFVSVFV